MNLLSTAFSIGLAFGHIGTPTSELPISIMLGGIHGSYQINEKVSIGAGIGVSIHSDNSTIFEEKTYQISVRGDRFRQTEIRVREVEDLGATASPTIYFPVNYKLKDRWEIGGGFFYDFKHGAGVAGGLSWRIR